MEYKFECSRCNAMVTRENISSPPESRGCPEGNIHMHNWHRVK